MHRTGPGQAGHIRVPPRPGGEAPEYAYAPIPAHFRSPPAGPHGTGPVHIFTLHTAWHGVRALASFLPFPPTSLTLDVGSAHESCSMLPIRGPVAMIRLFVSPPPRTLLRMDLQADARYVFSQGANIEGTFGHRHEEERCDSGEHSLLPQGTMRVGFAVPGDACDLTSPRD